MDCLGGLRERLGLAVLQSTSRGGAVGSTAVETRARARGCDPLGVPLVPWTSGPLLCLPSPAWFYLSSE